jgi:hypothetical protein
MNTQDNLQVELKGDDSLNQLSDRANKILKTLPTELQVYDSSHQISDRINEILEPMRGLRGAKNDFVTYFPEYNTSTGSDMLKRAFAKVLYFSDFRMWICLELWVEDVKKRQPDWFTKG